MANKVWVVHWGSGTLDDDGNVSSYCGVHSVYSSKDSAKKGLTLCKDKLIEDIKNPYIEDAETKEELQEQLNDLKLEVYGSENEEYFEIDYTSCDVRNEIYVGISEQEFK